MYRARKLRLIEIERHLFCEIIKRGRGGGSTAHIRMKPLLAVNEVLALPSTLLAKI